MRWKERFIGDWMSVPIWSAAPGWLKYAVLAGIIAALVWLVPFPTTCIVLGGVQVIGSVLFVGLRAAGSVTSEREKQTFDSLLATRMDARQLIRGKLWGHIDAVRPYMLVYLIAATPCALSVDVLAGLGLVYAWLCSWLCLYYVGAIGVTASASAPSTWRGILATLIGCFGALALTQLFLTYILITIWAFLIIMMLPASLQPIGAGAGAVLAPIPGLLWLFAASEERLQQAEQWLIEHDHAASGP